MCIAIYIPAGKDIKDEQIKNAFANNKDGAGVMHYDRNGRVHYTKGFMDVESLINYWRHSTSSQYPRAIHCRIATSGKVSKGCCHPFPITDNLDSMLTPQGISETGCLMHNGVFSRFTPKDGMKSPYSDTMVFTQKVINPLRELLANSGVNELLSDMTSKVLVFLPNFKVYKYGNWQFESEQGFYASNDTYDYNWSKWRNWRSVDTCCSTYSYPYYGYSYNVDGTATESGNKFTLEDKAWEEYETSVRTPLYSYGIAFTAKSLYEAEDMVYKFMDKFDKTLFDDGWEAFETLEKQEEDTWVFYVQAYHDISSELKDSEYVVFEYEVNK